MACSSSYLNLSRGGGSAQIKMGKLIKYCSSGMNDILSALCIAAPKSRCPCCFVVHPPVIAYGRCTLHSTVSGARSST